MDWTSKPFASIGKEQDWANELGLANIPWWATGYDFAVTVVSESDCINALCTGSELHIVSRDYPLLLRAVWLALHAFGWRHYMPNGVAGLEELWVYKDQRDTISTNVRRVWSGVVDQLLSNITLRRRCACSAAIYPRRYVIAPALAVECNEAATIACRACHRMSGQHVAAARVKQLCLLAALQRCWQLVDRVLRARRFGTTSSVDRYITCEVSPEQNKNWCECGVFSGWIDVRLEFLAVEG